MENMADYVVNIADSGLIEEQVKYATFKCAACGKQSNFSGWFRITMDEKYRELVSPYEPGEYDICAGCVLKAFGVPLPSKETPHC